MADNSTGNPLASILSGFTKSFGGAFLQQAQRKQQVELAKQQQQLEILRSAASNVRPEQLPAYMQMLEKFTEDIGKGGSKAKKERGGILSQVFGSGGRQQSLPQGGATVADNLAVAPVQTPQGDMPGGRPRLAPKPVTVEPSTSKPMLMTTAEKARADFEAMKPQLDYEHQQNMEKIGLEAEARAKLESQREQAALRKQQAEDAAKLARQNDREANAHLGKLPELKASFKAEGMSDEQASEAAAKMITDDFRKSMEQKDARVRSLNEGIINHRRALDQADERIAQSATRNSIAYLKVQNDISTKGLKTEKDDALKSLGEASARLNQQMQRKAQVEANATGKKPEEVARDLKALEPDIDGAVGAVANAEAALKSISEKYDAVAASLPPLAALTPKPKRPLKRRDGASMQTVEIGGQQHKVGDVIDYNGKKQRIVAIKTLNGKPHVRLEDVQ